MHEGIQGLQGLLIGKHHIGQTPAIKHAGRIHDSCTESIHHGHEKFPVHIIQPLGRRIRIINGVSQ